MTDYLKRGVVSGDKVAPALDRGKEILNSYALTLGLHALGIPVEFKEVPEYKCKDATTPIKHA